MKNKNLPLVVGIALPLVFILIISVVIFAPSFFITPHYNFLYSVDENYYAYGPSGYQNGYIVTGDHLNLEAYPVVKNGVPQVYRGEKPPLYLYDVKTDSSHQVSFDDAKNYTVDPGPSSPDGYTVKYEYSNEGIFGLFGSSGNNYGYFVEKDNGKKKLNGIAATDRYSYQGNFKFIGWVK
jgi:hypothetical protein